jgi:hypothetical protein
MTSLGALEVGVVETDRHGSIKAVEIEERSFGRSIDQPRPLASVQIDNNPKTIHEHVLLES